MRWIDLKASLSDFWFEFRREKSGLIGLGLLLFFVFLAIFAPLIVPSEANTHWRDVTYWQNLPRAVPPEWVNVFSAKKKPPHMTLLPADTETRQIGKIVEVTYTFEYEYAYDVHPTDLMLILALNITDPNNPPTLSLTVIRPDNRTIDLLATKLAVTGVGGQNRLLISSLKDFKARLVGFAREFETKEAAAGIEYQLIDPLQILFSKAQPGILSAEQAEPLKGTYVFTAKIYLFNPQDNVSDISFIVAGRVYGLLGTDTLRRDLFAGLVWGTRVSLAVGIVSSVLTTLIGVVYGVASAYFGGWTDEAMQRVAEIVASIPVLPLLIIIFEFYKPTIWPVIILMTIFSWPGTNKVVRSMGFQLKEMPYVEAARALGATGRWIILRHMMPQILPYVFASIALGVPGYVLLEAGLSFLGLGDVSRVTWGQILHDAQGAAATLHGMWWWVIPPGLAIALMGLSFALIGAALNRILSPKMKTL